MEKETVDIYIVYNKRNNATSNLIELVDNILPLLPVVNKCNMHIKYS